VTGLSLQNGIGRRQDADGLTRRGVFGAVVVYRRFIIRRTRAKRFRPRPGPLRFFKEAELPFAAIVKLPGRPALGMIYRTGRAAGRPIRPGRTVAELVRVWRTFAVPTGKHRDIDWRIFVATDIDDVLKRIHPPRLRSLFDPLQLSITKTTIHSFTNRIRIFR